MLTLALSAFSWQIVAIMARTVLSPSSSISISKSSLLVMGLFISYLNSLSKHPEVTSQSDTGNLRIHQVGATKSKNAPLSVISRCAIALTPALPVPNVSKSVKPRLTRAAEERVKMSGMRHIGEHFLDVASKTQTHHRLLPCRIPDVRSAD